METPQLVPIKQFMDVVVGAGVVRCTAVYLVCEMQNQIQANIISYAFFTGTFIISCRHHIKLSSYVSDMHTLSLSVNCNHNMNLINNIKAHKKIKRTPFYKKKKKKRLAVNLISDCFQITVILVLS